MKTVTMVHSAQTALVQRSLAEGKAYGALWGVMLFAQVMLYGTLAVLPLGTNAAWWVAVAMILPALGVWGLLQWATSGGISLQAAIESGLGQWGTAVCGIVYGLLIWLDLTVALSGLAELTSAFVIEEGGVWPMTLWGAAATIAGVWMGRELGAARCCYLLRWILAAALAGCVIAALPLGERSFLLAGQRQETVKAAAKATGWVGSLWPIVLAGFRPDKANQIKASFKPAAWALAGGTLLFFAYCFTLPPAALSGALTWGERMVLFLRPSPSKLMWEILLNFKMAILLLNLCGGASLGGRLLTRLTAPGVHPGIFATGLVLAAIPLAGQHTRTGLEWLAAALPWRLPVALLPLAAAGIGWRIRQRRKQ